MSWTRSGRIARCAIPLASSSPRSGGIRLSAKTNYDVGLERNDPFHGWSQPAAHRGKVPEVGVNIVVGSSDKMINFAQRQENICSGWDK